MKVSIRSRRGQYRERRIHGLRSSRFESNYWYSTGFTAEVGWRWIGLHYTKMDYSSEGYEDADASHIGVRFTYEFGGPK